MSISSFTVTIPAGSTGGTGVNAGGGGAGGGNGGLGYNGLSLGGKAYVLYLQDAGDSVTKSTVTINGGTPGGSSGGGSAGFFFGSGQ